MEEAQWLEKDQRRILESFMWGFLVTQVPGGIMADQFGGKHVFGLGVLMSSLFCLFTPLALTSSVEASIVIRFLTGFSQGVTLPAATSLISKWAPSPERTTIGAAVLSGTTTTKKRETFGVLSFILFARNEIRPSHNFAPNGLPVQIGPRLGVDVLHPWNVGNHLVLRLDLDRLRQSGYSSDH